MSPGSRVLLSILLIGFVSSTFGSVLGFTGMSLLWAGEALSDAGQSIRALDRISLIIGSSLLLLIGHGVSFVIHFLALGEFRRARVGTLLLLPFKRCLALFVCMAVTIAVVLKWPSLASATGFAAVVIALKVAWDCWLHLGERHTFAEPALEEAAG
jgi:hypothetical protein